MYNFIVKRRPASLNSWAKNSKKGKDYKSFIEDSFKTYNREHAILTGELYGTVFHFFNKDLKIDADNISKPVWDCLEEFLFNNDYQVKIRIAGSFDLTNNNHLDLDFSGLDEELVKELISACNTEQHVIYIECGQLNYSMYKFNFYNYGD